MDNCQTCRKCGETTCPGTANGCYEPLFTDEQKLVNYKQYVEAKVEMNEMPMLYDQFIESLLAEHDSTDS